jgi:predicted polyphosphate/ATP-dependent NAD kinase
MFLRKDHPKFMKKRQIANSNNKFRKHQKHITKEPVYDIVDKRTRSFDVKKSRFNKVIINHEMDMLATNVLLYTLTITNRK